MEELIKLMSMEDIVALKDKYATNPSVTTLLEGVIATRVKEEAQAKAKADFVKAIDKLVTKLPHPDDILNIYFAWREVEMPVGEPEEVEVVKVNPDNGKPVAGENGKPIMVKVMRQPTTRTFKWVVEVNKGFQVKQGDGGGKATTSKRAITIYKRNGTNLEPKGSYPSASKACEKLGLVVGGDSGARVLAREGYIVEAYTGTDYTA